MIDYDQEFLNRWVPEVIEPKVESRYDAPRPSSLCKECGHMGEDMVCDVRGFQMDLAPAVYACVEWTGQAHPDEEPETVEIVRMFTARVKQVLKVAPCAASNVEEKLRGKSLQEMGRELEAALNADSVSVTDHTVVCMG